MLIIIKRDGRYLKDSKSNEWTEQQAAAEVFRIRQSAERAAAMAGGGELCTVSPSATQAHVHKGVRYEPPQARPRAAQVPVTSAAAAIAAAPVHVSASPLLALVSRHVEQMPPNDLRTLVTLGEQAAAQLGRLEAALEPALEPHADNFGHFGPTDSGALTTNGAAEDGPARAAPNVGH